MISIIVTAYNVQKYIAQCLESILLQTYHDWEAIVVDDGSTDSTGDICESYGKKDARIRIIHQENAGVSEARNRALNCALGDYIFILDGDDYLEQDALDTLYSYAEKYDSRLTVASYNKVDECGKFIGQCNFELNAECEFLDENEIWKRNQKEFAYIVVWGKLYSRELWENNRFPAGRIHEDEAVAHLMISQCPRILFVNKPVVNYRTTPNSITHKKLSLGAFDYCKAIEERIYYFWEKKEFELAIDFWGFGSRYLIRCFEELDRRNPIVREKIKQTHHSYVKMAKFLYRHGSKMNFVRMFIFAVNFQAYIGLQKYSKEKYNREVNAQQR